MFSHKYLRFCSIFYYLYNVVNRCIILVEYYFQFVVSNWLITMTKNNNNTYIYIYIRYSILQLDHIIYTYKLVCVHGVSHIVTLLFCSMIKILFVSTKIKKINPGTIFNGNSLSCSCDIVN